MEEEQSMFEVFSPECKSGVSNGEGWAWFYHSELKREKETGKTDGLVHCIASPVP